MPKKTQPRHNQKPHFTTKQAITLLGSGALVCVVVVMPGLAYLADAYLKWKHRQKAQLDSKDLKQFHPDRVKQTFKRLHQQKDVMITDKDGLSVVELTIKGKRKLLRYNLEKIALESNTWDGKWRLISYDVPQSKASARDMIRFMLKKLNCLKIQKSLYLTPFQCENQINFLRELFDVGENVTYFTVSELEGADFYKSHFRL